MLCKLHTATLLGVDALPVEVEVAVAGGIPGFFLVGLPDGATREGSVRIRSAIENSGFKLGSVRITVNLAPADLRKDGSAFDLPIALGSLIAGKQIECIRGDLLLAGELALDGRLRSIPGALCLAQSAHRQGHSGIVLPSANATEAALVDGLSVYGVSTLAEAAELVAGRSDPSPARATRNGAVARGAPDFADVRGQAAARRAAEVAAAGGHNLLLIGPPGAGKTMIAQRIGGLLPEISREEAIETTKIHSVAGLLRDQSLLYQRPFRAPHHTCSTAGLIGGGGRPRPGEASLSHNGVLFLDELPEFQRQTLEALRQPLECGYVSVVRARHTLTFPARFMLVAAMNPCPCGYRGSRVRTCTCGEREALRYVNRVSGPLLDRFDLFVRVAPVPTEELLGAGGGEASRQMAERVATARRIQNERFTGSRARCNAQIPARWLWRYCVLTASGKQLLARYAQANQLSARVVHRCCRVARTIADLHEAPTVTDEYVALALSMQRERWIH